MKIHRFLATELDQTKVMGMNIPNALGIPNFDDFDTFILEDILKGASDEEIRINLANDDFSQFILFIKDLQN